MGPPSTFKLQNIQSGIPIARIHHAISRDKNVCSLRRESDVRTRIDELVWHGRHPVGDLFRGKGIPYIEHAYTGVVVGRENRFFAAETTGAILVKIVRPEGTCLAQKFLSFGCWQR